MREMKNWGSNESSRKSKAIHVWHTRQLSTDAAANFVFTLIEMGCYFLDE